MKVVEQVTLLVHGLCSHTGSAGTDIFVAGSAIFKSPDYRQAIKLMREKIAS